MKNKDTGSTSINNILILGRLNYIRYNWITDKGFYNGLAINW